MADLIGERWKFFSGGREMVSQSPRDKNRWSIGDITHWISTGQMRQLIGKEPKDGMSVEVAFFVRAID